MSMRPLKCVILSALLAGLAAGPAATAQTSSFDPETTEDLLAACTADDSNSLHVELGYFCAGFVEGAGHYHDAVSGDELKPLICAPPGATLEEAVTRFVAWAEARSDDPEAMAAPPIAGLVRALAAAWPCI